MKDIFMFLCDHKTVPPVVSLETVGCWWVTTYQPSRGFSCSLRVARFHFRTLNQRPNFLEKWGEPTHHHLHHQGSVQSKHTLAPSSSTSSLKSAKENLESAHGMAHMIRTIDSHKEPMTRRIHAFRPSVPHGPA
jgi:hypothetical protein